MSNVLYLREDPFEFPLTENMIKARFPNVSWESDNFDPPTGYFRVYKELQPQETYDKVYVTAEPVKVEGVYRQTWTEVLLPPETVAARLLKMKSDLKDKVAQTRWIKETSGITIPTGENTSINVGTTIADQNRITTVISNCEIAGIETINFKAGDGWVTLNIPTLKMIATEIAHHVQTCFTSERQHCDAIDLLETYEQISTYNTQLNW